VGEFDPLFDSDADLGSTGLIFLIYNPVGPLTFWSTQKLSW